jgi:hypothetical protein
MGWDCGVGWGELWPQYDDNLQLLALTTAVLGREPPRHLTASTDPSLEFLALNFLVLNFAATHATLDSSGLRPGLHRSHELGEHSRRCH